MIRAVAVMGCIFAISEVAAAPVPKEVAKASVRAGTWMLVKIDLPDGGVSTGMTHSWVIDAQGDVIFRGPQEKSEEIRFRLTFDPAAKHCDYRTPRMTDPYRGIYELDRDTLRIAIDFNGGPRPTGFSKPPAYTYHFHRVKESK